MYISAARGQSKRFYPISVEAQQEIDAAVGSLLSAKHSFDSMQFYFISAIVRQVEQSEISRTQQAETILRIHRDRFYQLQRLLKKFQPAETPANGNRQ